MQLAITHEPTAMELLVSEITRTGFSAYSGPVQGFPARLRLDLYAAIDVLAAEADTSKNKMLNNLVDIAVTEALRALPSDVAERVAQRRQDRLIQLIGHASEEAAEGEV